MGFIEEHGVLVLGIACVIFIILYGVIRILKGSEGSWSEKIETSTSNKRVALSEGERRTRQYLETFFQKPFPKARPDFLKNKITQANLEIDCFNEELRLGAEYNGRQHYEFVPYFHASKEVFQNQQYRDELKRAACKEHDVTLIEVPYTEDARLEQWLEEKLHSLGYAPS